LQTRATEGGFRADGVATREKTVLVLVQDRRCDVERMVIIHPGPTIVNGSARIVPINLTRSQEEPSPQARNLRLANLCVVTGRNP
jgi:hypothetical protein